MKKVLIADDDPAICDALQFMLEQEGYNVVATTNGTTIKHLITTQKPHIILLDLWMSGVDGKEVCKSIKDDLSTQRLPVILVSASRDIKQSAREAQADDFIEKPFRMDDLLRKVFLYSNKLS